MARWMRNDTNEIYRVAIKNPITGHVMYYGPYEFKRSAGFVKSYMTTDFFGRRTSDDSWIEVCEPAWEKVSG